jgi:hypothetical protein
MSKPTAIHRTISIVFLFILTFAGLNVVAQPSPARADGVVNRDAWTVDYSTESMVRYGNRLIVGGRFRNTGIYTGSAAVFNRTTGELDKTFPNTESQPKTIIPDGNNGWYVANDGLNVLRILPTNEFDPNWRLGNAPFFVGAWLVYGDKLIVGGEDSSNKFLTLVDKVTGERITTITLPEFDSTVMALAIDGTTLYVGGYFTRVGNQPRRGLAAIDLTTYQLLPWNPRLTYPYDTQLTVTQLAVNDGTVYFSGTFDTVNEQPRINFAAVDAATGALKNLNLNLDPESFSRIRTMMIRDNVIYLGGRFTFNGSAQPTLLTALDITTGQSTSFSPQVVGDEVFTLARIDNILYVGGAFSAIGGQPTRYLAAINATTGANLGWNPSPNGAVRQIALQDNKIAIVGYFNLVYSRPRNGLTSFDATTGLPQDWNPLSIYPNQVVVTSLELYGSKLYLVAAQYNVGYMILSIDLSTNQITTVRPPSDTGIYKIARWNNKLFYTGSGDNAIRALNINTGEDLGSGPSLGAALPRDRFVERLIVHGNTVYITGPFSSVGGLPRPYVAAFDASTGVVNSWNPAPNNEVYDLAAGANGIYIAGNFTQIGGLERKYLVAVHPITASVTAWNPNPDGRVHSLSLYGNTLYVTGWFSQIGGVVRNAVAALNVNTGIPTNYQPIPVTLYNQLLVGIILATGNEVYFNGTIQFSLSDTQGTILFTRDTQPLPTPTPTGTPLPPRPDTIGVYKNGVFSLRNSNSTGGADITAAFGGDPSDLPVVGDWNGNGVDTIGVYRSSTGFFYLSDSNTAPTLTYNVLFGNPGDSPFAGRWTPDMTGDGIGVYRNSNGILYQKKTLTNGFDDFFAVFGNPGDQGVAGDWNADGFDSIGIYRPSLGRWFLSNNSTPGGITFSDLDFDWTIGTNSAVVGDWDGDNDTTVGYHTNTGVFVLHPNNATAGTDTTFAFGPAGGKPIAGKWSAPNRPPMSVVIQQNNPGGSNADIGDAD